MSAFSTNSVDHFNVIILFPPLEIPKMFFLRIAVSFFVRIMDLNTEPKKWYTEKCMKKFFWNSNFPLRFFRVLVQRRWFRDSRCFRQGKKAQGPEETKTHLCSSIRSLFCHVRKGLKERAIFARTKSHYRCCVPYPVITANARAEYIGNHQALFLHSFFVTAPCPNNVTDDQSYLRLIEDFPSCEDLLSF